MKTFLIFVGLWLASFVVIPVFLVLALPIKISGILIHLLVDEIIRIRGTF